MESLTSYVRRRIMEGASMEDAIREWEELQKEDALKELKKEQKNIEKEKKEENKRKKKEDVNKKEIEIDTKLNEIYSKIDQMEVLERRLIEVEKNIDKLKKIDDLIGKFEELSQNVEKRFAELNDKIEQQKEDEEVEIKISGRVYKKIKDIAGDKDISDFLNKFFEDDRIKLVNDIYKKARELKGIVVKYDGYNLKFYRYVDWKYGFTAGAIITALISIGLFFSGIL